MKRREFIGLIGASALSLPFLWSELSPGIAPRNNRISAADKVRMRLKLPKDVQKVAAELSGKSKKVYLLGGTAAAAAAGVELPYVNLLVDTPKFSAVKQSLFEFGVTPHPTPEFPANLARFTYEDRSYNLVNMKFDSYAEWSVTCQEKGLILFAHNYLIYSPKDGFMLDPYNALNAKSDEGQFLIRPIRQPKTLVDGFQHYLAATFDAALLGLKPSLEYQQLEERVLEATPSEPDSKAILGYVIDYASDMIEVGGLDTLNRMLTAPVCVAAAKNEMDIDLSKVAASLRRQRQQGHEVAARDFIRVVDTELKKKEYGIGAAGGLPEYLAMSGTQFRRTGVIHEVYENKAVPA